MVRIAGERIGDLFAEAEEVAQSPHPQLADRYVRLARRIGMRHNVRLISELRELYCRRCSAFWVEGRTVRTRLRGGYRVRTCLACGDSRRVRIRSPSLRRTQPPGTPRSSGPPEPVPAEPEAPEVYARVDSDGEDG
jgi:ribonuclease P protein subunit RPR2